MLTGSITKRIDLPHEPGEWVEVRLLSWRQLAAAKEARSTAAIKRFGAIGDALQALHGLGNEGRSVQVERPEDDYDISTVLEGSIVGWSYPEAVSSETIDQLDQETVDLLMTVLLPKASESDRKNGSGLSTGS